ncbi:exopolysaccharide biosynthesis protein [Arsukibacterium ikkense]|uniref:non-specific protein-tyrosine kinase n=1 Tax=Arsukibacterium ikkense TaxID=336831 RepID=A0A0M2VB68_9GAMM|nr:XrtA-associated tyrosine autokinase [Arsukibacterium ikkense]KKO46870.1 exopolysaccharide biosynthesis protein [Arsukibacterium ikkense]
MSIIEKAVSKLNQDSTTKSDPARQPANTLTEPADVVSRQDAKRSKPAVNPDSSSHMVQLDLATLEKKHFVSLSSERRLINEEYRVIKRKLINNAFGALSKTLNHPNLILVSSSRPGEGKTFSAINLALSIALEQDKTVLLVDADVLRPNVSKTLNISHSLGLTDYLQSPDVTVPDILLSTNVERLKIITAGSPHHLSTELLASERMLQLVNEFATRYSDRIVIFDAPPLLGVNETAVMAAMCGQAVIVVEENRTRLAEIEQSVSLLPKEMAMGFLINKAHRNQGKGYGYGYYYGAS